MKTQVIFYSMYGHVYRMAEAVAAGAREISGNEVEIFQVPLPVTGFARDPSHMATMATCWPEPVLDMG